jgi:hypothetical protein
MAKPACVTPARWYYSPSAEGEGQGVMIEGRDTEKKES